MRYMRWGYQQLQECPDAYVAVIKEMAAEAAEEAARRARNQELQRRARQ